MKKNKMKWKGNKIVIELEPLKPRIGVIFSKVVSNKKLKKHKIKHKNKVAD
jgi:hypothetical protein